MGGGPLRKERRRNAEPAAGAAPRMRAQLGNHNLNGRGVRRRGEEVKVV